MNSSFAGPKNIIDAKHADYRDAMHEPMICFTTLGMNVLVISSPLGGADMAACAFERSLKVF